MGELEIKSPHIYPCSLNGVVAKKYNHPPYQRVDWNVFSENAAKVKYYSYMFSDRALLCAPILLEDGITHRVSHSLLDGVVGYGETVDSAMSNLLNSLPNWIHLTLEMGLEQVELQ